MNIAIQNVVREIDFGSSLTADSDTAAKYFEDADAALRSLGPPSSRSGDAKRDAQDIKVRSRLIKEQFLRRHVGAIFDTATDKRTRTLRVCDLLYTVADRFPGLVPTRQRIHGERALQLQSAKEGFEIDQGLFIAHILADPERGLHLVHAMRKPRREALEKLDEFQKNGVVELGEARVERLFGPGVIDDRRRRLIPACFGVRAGRHDRLTITDQRFHALGTDPELRRRPIVQPERLSGGTGNEGPSPNTQLVIGHRLKSKTRIAKNEADFLKLHAPGPFKITLPSPVVFAAIFWRRGVSEAAYPTPGDFLTDAASILASEAQALANEGTPYIQLDAPAYTHWADESLTAKYQQAGFDMDRFLSEAIAAENTILDAAAPATTGVHLCRGNSMGRWLAEGGYDKIAEKLFNELSCDRLLLEYDSPRAGDFTPLRFVPKNKIVVLGLITTKHGKLETADDIVRRIDEAARYLSVEQLALSPQCGFASSGRGNPLTEDQQWRKLELVSAVAETVWKH
jgi:5-methyltetrahydropteroyltriglutamate--homocysteine methyltransferase